MQRSENRSLGIFAGVTCDKDMKISIIGAFLQSFKLVIP